MDSRIVRGTQIYQLFFNVGIRRFQFLLYSMTHIHSLKENLLKIHYGNYHYSNEEV